MGGGISPVVSERNCLFLQVSEQEGAYGHHSNYFFFIVAASANNLKKKMAQQYWSVQLVKNVISNQDGVSDDTSPLFVCARV